MLDSNLTALDVWDDTIYPFQQSMTDLTGMQAAIAALGRSPIRYKQGLQALEGVNLAWYGTHFGYPVYLANLLQRVPGYVHANMADLGHMAMTLDVIPEYNAVLATQAAGTAPTEAIDALKTKITDEQSDVEGRLQTLTGVLTDVAGQIRAITPAQ